jgi:N6-adenosine-specific RNA methylase IME4
MKRFICCVTDPPWPFSDHCPGKGRGAAKHYETMSLADNIAYHHETMLPQLADVAWVFMWRVAAMQADALILAQELGLTVKAEMVWVKTKDPARRRLQIGMGHFTRGCHETCLICVRGKSPSRLTLSHSEPSVFFAARGAHSAKPDEFYEKVERLVPGPRLELFARKLRQGWTQIGDQLEF